MSRVIDWHEATTEEAAAAARREGWAPPQKNRCDALILEGSPKYAYPRRCLGIRSRDANSRYCWVHAWYARPETRRRTSD